MVKEVSIADEVFKRLEDDILYGALSKGEIISELKVCSQLNVSRTPVREAISRLVQEGLVEQTTKGAVVIGITKQDVCDIYDIRIRIEGMASAYCAQKATDEQIAKLKEIVEDQEYYAENDKAEKLKEQDSLFHEAIYAISGSKTLESVLSELHRKVQRCRLVSVQNKERAKLAAKEHLAIFEAIKSHDASLAEILTVQHITNAKNNILKNI